jgi:hypothetical protein
MFFYLHSGNFNPTRGLGRHFPFFFCIMPTIILLIAQWKVEIISFHMYLKDYIATFSLTFPTIFLRTLFDQVYSSLQLLQCRIVYIFYSHLSVLENSPSKLPIISENYYYYYYYYKLPWTKLLTAVSVSLLSRSHTTYVQKWILLNFCYFPLLPNFCFWIGRYCWLKLPNARLTNSIHERGHFLLNIRFLGHAGRSNSEFTIILRVPWTSSYDLIMTWDAVAAPDVVFGNNLQVVPLRRMGFKSRLLSWPVRNVLSTRWRLSWHHTRRRITAWRTR